MTLEIIQAKRAALLAECERAKGAIQALDDLIAEVAADRDAKAAEAAQEKLAAQIAAFKKVRERVEAGIPPPLSQSEPLPTSEEFWASCPAFHGDAWLGAPPPLASESPPMSPPSPPLYSAPFEACFCSDLKSDRCSNCTAGK